MSTLKNTATLEKLTMYLEDTNFGNQEIGHRLTLGFLPAPYDTQLEDIRYTFNFRHRLLGQDLEFKKVTYSEAIIKMIIGLNQNLSEKITKKSLGFYQEVGLIDSDGWGTKALIADVVGNGIVTRISKHTGNVTNNIKTTDNLQNVFTEYRPAVLKYFLEALDNYTPPQV